MIMSKQQWSFVLQWIILVILGCLLLHTVIQTRFFRESFAQPSKVRQKSQKSAKKIFKDLFSPPQKPDKPHTTYLLWSGGVASTFVLCDRILRFGETVRPIHLSITNIDTRKSVSQERETVYAMESYLRSNFPKQMKSKLLPVIEYVHIDDSKSGLKEEGDNKQPQTQTYSEDVSKALGLTNERPSSNLNFYVKLAALAHILRTQKPYHNKSRLIVVLPQLGPYQRMRRCVEAWCTTYHPHDPSRFVINNDISASNSIKINGDKSTFVSLYKHIEWVLPDKSPEGLHMKKHALEHNPPFEHVLRRTWSCRNPMWTKEQNERRKLNPFSMITTMPIGKCNICISCEQRMMDGLHRID